MHNTTSNNQLSNGKLLLGAVCTPLLALLSSGHGVNICTGIFGLLAVISWVLIYFRAAAMVRTITGRPAGRAPAHYTAAAPPPPAPPADDSRSIFL